MLDAKTFAKAVLARPSWLLLPLMEAGAFDRLDDERYLKLSHRVITGERLNLDAPETFNDKIAWCKLHDHNPLYRKLADKLGAREFVAEKLDESWLVPLLGVYRRPEDIDYDSLPDRFVLKCTHGYGGTVICRDRASFDASTANEILAGTLATDFYGRGREWAYAQADPRIVAEQFVDDGGARPADYKFMCFNGEALMACVSRAVSADHKQRGSVSFFHVDGERMPFKRADYPEYSVDQPFPACYPSMYEAAGKLAREVGAPFVRVDFYEMAGRPYFSEFTFYPCGGTMMLEPKEYGCVLGDFMQLPDKDERISDGI
jgi:hypothetical protein